MPDSVVLKFTDPYEHQRSVRAAEAEFFVTAPGAYQAELTRIDLHRLWMQRNQLSLPHIAHYAVKKDRNVILFLAEPDHPPIHHSGFEITAHDIIVESLASEHYQRVPTTCHWAAMSLSSEDLAAVGRSLLGRDLVAPAATHPIRPPPHLMARLSSLHETAGRLAATVPDILAHPAVARAIEQELLRAMVGCLSAGTETATAGQHHHRAPVMRRFERVLEENPTNPLYLTEICAAIGVADRTLRLHCLEHLGMSPHRYLWLRRMHLARRALALADPATKTVTGIANDHGFGELGRFAVAYRQLFGESPSATLRRTSDRAGAAVPAVRLPVLP